MDHKPLLVGLLLLMLAIIGGYLVSSRQSAMPTGEVVGEETATSTSTTGNVLPTSKTASPRSAPISQAAAKKLPSYTCTFDALGKISGEHTRIRGALFSSEGKTRLDTTTEVGNVAVETYSLESGDAVYTWRINTMTGTKKYGSLDTSVIPSLEGSGSVLRNGMTINWDCHAWIPDPKVLVLPKGVTFTVVK